MQLARYKVEASFCNLLAFVLLLTLLYPNFLARNFLCILTNHCDLINIQLLIGQVYMEYNEVKLLQQFFSALHIFRCLFT